MVSRPTAARLPLVRRSLQSYAAQTYADRELVVVIDARASLEERALLLAALEAIVNGEVRVVAPEAGLTLGALRNVSIGAASGSVLCQWDDDDFQHPHRLEVQHRAMRESGYRASYLVDAMLFDLAARRLVWTNWAATPTRAHPGTLMCDAGLAAAYPETGPTAWLSEDVAFLEQLERNGPIHRMPGFPHFYIYVTHAGNTTTADHHAMLVRELGISRALLARREAALREGLAALDFEGEVSVEGPNGPAFRI
jgi:glycosyltransferase involved in cell wall biosynthesis